MEYLEVRGAVFRIAGDDSGNNPTAPAEIWDGRAWVPSDEISASIWTDGDVRSLSPEALASRGIPE